MATSAVPAALSALVTILQSAPGLEGVRVSDGPPVTDLSDLDQLFIGWQPDTETAVSLDQDFAGAGARTRDERFDIACYAEARSGDTDIAARRARVFELLGEVENALRASDAAPTAPTLNNTVLWAHLTVGNLTQIQREGSLAGVAFVVRCQARI